MALRAHPRAGWKVRYAESSHQNGSLKVGEAVKQQGPARTPGDPIARMTTLGF